jgi:hypothetical protein
VKFMNISNKKIVCAFTIIILALAIAIPTVNAQSNASDVRLHLTGPSVLGTLRSGTFSVTFIDPDSRVWTYKAYITAANTTGASPLVNSPINGTLTVENNSFTFDVTAQQDSGELDLHINCTSGSLYYEKVQTIPVVYPIAFNVDINNPSNVVINNATVQFYVDGSEIDMQVIQSLNARQNTKVSSEWITNDAKSGWHDSRIVVDLNGDGVIDTQAGDMIVENRFYIEGGRDWIFASIVLIGLIALIIGFVYISKRNIK